MNSALQCKPATLFNSDALNSMINKSSPTNGYLAKNLKKIIDRRKKQINFCLLH